MTVAVTGGTGFIGRRLVHALANDGRDVAVLTSGLTDPPSFLVESPRVSLHRTELQSVDRVTSIFETCDAVAHLAGINHERGTQSYEQVHRRATDTVVTAAERAALDRIVITSYLRARPNCGSGYLESKWDAEQRVRSGTVEWCVLKPAGVFGPGDQFLSGLARWMKTIPVVPTVGLRARDLRPVAVDDVVHAIETALTDESLVTSTYSLLGPNAVTIGGLARAIGDVIDRRPLVVPAPVMTQRIAAMIFERILDPPLVTAAGARMLAEGMTAPAPRAVVDPVPQSIRPTTPLNHETIQRAVGDVSRYGRADVQLF